jgi:hypothetical protein
VECKKRDVNTLEVWEALVSLGPDTRPEWLIPQFQHHLPSERDAEEDHKGEQQVLRPTFEGIRDGVIELLRNVWINFAREFAATHDPKVRQEPERLSIERGKLREPWKFISL